MKAGQDSGIYILLITLDKARNIRIGKRGGEYFPSGYYAYIGSARRGLKKRVQRHLRKKKKLHWHVDYLLEFAEVKRVYEFGLEENSGRSSLTECELAARVSELPGASLLHTRFGASDCRCPGHLYYFKKSPDKDIKSLM